MSPKASSRSLRHGRTFSSGHQNHACARRRILTPATELVRNSPVLTTWPAGWFLARQFKILNHIPANTGPDLRTSRRRHYRVRAGAPAARSQAWADAQARVQVGPCDQPAERVAQRKRVGAARSRAGRRFCGVESEDVRQLLPVTGRGNKQMARR
jgi:hypothetical protein